MDCTITMAPQAPKKRASSVIDISSDEDAEPSKAQKKGKYTEIDLMQSEDDRATDSDDKMASDAPKGMFSGKDLKSLIKPLPVSNCLLVCCRG